MWGKEAQCGWVTDIIVWRDGHMKYTAFVEVTSLSTQSMFLLHKPLDQ